MTVRELRQLLFNADNQDLEVRVAIDEPNTQQTHYERVTSVHTIGKGEPAECIALNLG